MSLEEFESYDFDGDEGWRSYQNNITFPPGREDLIIKYKAKYYKNNINPDFDVSLIKIPSSSTTTSQPKQPSPPPPSSQPSSQPQPRQQPSTTNRTTNTTQSSRPGIGDLALFCGHIFLVITSIIVLIPFNRILSYNCYFAFCRVSIIVHASRLIRRHGLPSIRAILPWFRTVSSTTDAFYALTSMVLLSNPHGWIGIYPMAILALYHAMAFLNSSPLSRSSLWRSSGLSSFYTTLASQREDALLMTSTLEILTLFQLVVLGVMRVGVGALMVSWVYLSQLKMRYWSPESRVYHIRAWSVLGERVQPLLRAVPMLNKGVERGKIWFNSVPQQQQQR